VYDVLEPTGPLPPEIYWRRRLVALGGLVVLLALVIWMIASLGGGGSSKPAPASTTASAVASSTDTSSADTDGSQSTTSAVAATSAASSGLVIPPPAAMPAPPGQCPDQSLAVKATVEQPTYRAGQEPVFQVVITNISTQPCQRDLTSMQQVLVYSLDGNTRLWSNTDCYPPAAGQLQNLNPGQQVAFRVTWAGSTSQPQCAGERVPVAPGAYVVFAQLGAIRSAAEPFNIAQ
jgi:hypothetical protein